MPRITGGTRVKEGQESCVHKAESDTSGPVPSNKREEGFNIEIVGEDPFRFLGRNGQRRG